MSITAIAASEIPEDGLSELRAISEAWLREYASEIGVNYVTLMEAAGDWLSSWQESPPYTYTDRFGQIKTSSLSGGEYHVLSYDTPDVCYTKNEEFWHHYEIVKKEAVDEFKKQNFFSCSC